MLDRISEMVEAAQAREGLHSDTEKAAMWAALFMNVTTIPGPAIIRFALIDQIADLIKLYHHDDVKKFLDESLNPAMSALRSDVEDFWKSRGR